MRRPLILDTSALVALFDAYDPVYRLWGRADRGEALLIVPAGAIIEANQQLKASHNAWSVLFFPRDVIPTALTAQVAIDIGPWSGSIAQRHVVYEAKTVEGIIVTRNPGDYDKTVAILAV